MGKKRIDQLLEQFKENQQQDLHNAAAIYTVAQVAVNELQAQAQQESPWGGTTEALPPAPPTFTKSELLQRYKSYNGCRSAAKQQGIKFSRTPSWKQLEIAFGYLETCQHWINAYMHQYPQPGLQGVSIQLKLE